MKRITIIVLAILIVIALGVLSFFYFSPASEKDGGGSGNPFSGLFPGESGDTPSSDDSSNDTDEPGATMQEGKLQRVSDAPVAGFTVIADDEESTTTPAAVRYIERDTGHVYEYARGGESRRLSNTTIPGIYSAQWGTAEDIIIRYRRDDTNTIETAYAHLEEKTATSTVPYELSTTFLPRDIPHITVRPSHLAYLQETQTGSRVITANLDGTNASTLRRSPLRDITIRWPREETITATTKPSGVSSGYFYSINTSTGRRTRILGALTGLTARMSPDGTRVLYSSSEETTPRLSLYNLETGESREIFATVADKCTWASSGVAYCAVPKAFPSGTYPDDWYQGEVSFNDTIWRIDLQTSDQEKIFDAAEEIDAVNLRVHETSNTLFFRNKKDSTLWSLRLER